MENVYIFRIRRSSEGTEGLLFTENFNCKVLELPWLDNKQNKSCIPIGKYETKVRHSMKFGTIYWILNVKDRTYVYIHSGNWAGNTNLGLKSHTYGCLLLGKEFGYLMGQRAVLGSRLTIKRFMEHMNNQPFTLHILEAFIGGI